MDPALTTDKVFLWVASLQVQIWSDNNPEVHRTPFVKERDYAMMQGSNNSTSKNHHWVGFGLEVYASARKK